MQTTESVIAGYETESRLIRFCPSCSIEFMEPLPNGYFACDNCMVVGQVDAYL
ncbi:hypothetical protein [Brevibacillus sp. SYSU BS000544]|uniref:hypothetical protein n=1 Tax=Brevibacillus sp. SYSU BS000544 TaxID=3416443 RepID=UPI003CE5B568